MRRGQPTSRVLPDELSRANTLQKRAAAKPEASLAAAAAVRAIAAKAGAWNARPWKTRACRVRTFTRATTHAGPALRIARATAHTVETRRTALTHYAASATRARGVQRALAAIGGVAIAISVTGSASAVATYASAAVCRSPRRGTWAVARATIADSQHRALAAVYGYRVAVREARRTRHVTTSAGRAFRGLYVGQKPAVAATTTAVRHRAEVRLTTVGDFAIAIGEAGLAGRDAAALGCTGRDGYVRQRAANVGT
ncbi:MAG: hypothetical protein RL701_6126 [Pseudomonadota bacterium]